ncbi:MAG: class I SAM-dependent rRNA methyltransferase [Defluviitaleaceae bacterium]|nr:class I SAM-dependent rRNA methyltransferase [Defluviitaleaceae bacterium]
MAKIPSVTINKKAAHALARGGCWVYAGDVLRADDTYENGGIVAVLDEKGRFLGQGFINDRSKIRIRLLTRRESSVIDGAFFAEAARRCVAYRKAAANLAACRLVFGEADFLPGLTVDLYRDILVVQSLALGIDRFKMTIIAALKAALRDEGVMIRGVYERSDGPSRAQEGLAPVKGFIGEPFDLSDVTIIENGLSLRVDVADGQKTGYFLDQWENRLFLRRFAKDAEALDCFCNAGGFALNLCAGGAKSVLAVDVSEDALSLARQNAVSNGYEDKISFLKADAFDLLREMAEEKRKFDVVVLDPPAFTKARSTVDGAIRGYKEINLRGMKLVRDGGYLATCSCSRFLGEELFRSLLTEAATDGNFFLRQAARLYQAADHPVVLGAEESDYLKCMVFQVFRR